MPEWSFGLEESRICESGKLDALFRGRVEIECWLLCGCGTQKTAHVIIA
jgi:hypothetical protein